MTRKILLLILLLFPVMMWGKDRHAHEKKKLKIKHFAPGRWVEVKRMKLDSTEVAFKDTLYLAFSIKDTFAYHTPNGFVYRGKYTIDDDAHLDFGYSHYDVEEKKPTRIVLTDPDGIYFFGVDTSALTTYGKVLKDDSAKPVTDIDQLIGHWTVYKRTVANNGSIDFDKEIKSVYITGPSSNPDKQGYIYCGNDGNSNPSWYIRQMGADQVLEVNGKNPRTIKVIKCQNGELILEEETARYYFKQFK